jgi:hypothetical protein
MEENLKIEKSRSGIIYGIVPLNELDIAREQNFAHNVNKLLILKEFPSTPEYVRNVLEFIEKRDVSSSKIEEMKKNYFITSQFIGLQDVEKLETICLADKSSFCLIPDGFALNIPYSEGNLINLEDKNIKNLRLNVSDSKDLEANLRFSENCVFIGNDSENVTFAGGTSKNLKVYLRNSKNARLFLPNSQDAQIDAQHANYLNVFANHSDRLYLFGNKMDAEIRTLGAKNMKISSAGTIFYPMENPEIINIKILANKDDESTIIFK